MTPSPPMPVWRSESALFLYATDEYTDLTGFTVDQVQQALLQGAYTASTPVAVVYKATWPEERIVRCTVGNLAESVHKAGITKTALIVAGDFLGTQYDRSKLYDPTFTTEYRKGSKA